MKESHILNWNNMRLGKCWLFCWLFQINHQVSVLFHHSLLGLLFEKFCLLLLDGAVCSFIKSSKAELQSLALSCIMNQLRARSIFEYDLARHGCIIEKHKRKKNQKRQSYLGNKTTFTSSFPSNHRHRL